MKPHLHTMVLPRDVELSEIEWNDAPPREKPPKKAPQQRSESRPPRRRKKMNQT